MFPGNVLRLNNKFHWGNRLTGMSALSDTISLFRLGSKLASLESDRSKNGLFLICPTLVVKRKVDEVTL